MTREDDIKRLRQTLRLVRALKRKNDRAEAELAKRPRQPHWLAKAIENLTHDGAK